MSCGSHRFCTSITCRPSEAALDGPGPAAVKASVDEGMSSRHEGAIVLRGWCTGPVVGVRDRRRPLTNLIAPNPSRSDLDPTEAEYRPVQTVITLIMVGSRSDQGRNMVWKSVWFLHLCKIGRLLPQSL